MSETTLIEWANHTFAPWFGCTKVAPECANCYAEPWTVLRFHKAEWGPHAGRVRSAQSTWERCLSQDRKAARDGVRRRIFCSELSDVFDNQAPDEWRAELWALISQCSNLDWLLLTKRIANVPKMVPNDWPLPNVWLGVTAGTQVGWDRDVAVLRTIPATIRFVSVEPMLEPIGADLTRVDWVICGGETIKPGQKDEHDNQAVARFTDPDWMRGLLAQCRKAGVAFFMKQMTNKTPIPDDLLIREFPV